MAHDPEKACPGHSLPKDGVALLAYDPEKWKPVFGKDHAQMQYVGNALRFRLNRSRHNMTPAIETVI
jgi:hypothetical protein